MQTDNQPDININDLNDALSQSFIHYDPTRVDYTVSNEELSLIENFTSPIWKDFTLTTLGLWVPCLINATSGHSKIDSDKQLTIEIILNYIVGIAALIICLVFFILWQIFKRKHKDIIAQIKKKPRYKVPASGR